MNMFDLRPGEEMKLEATVLDVKHVGTSRNGNPQYMVQTSQGGWKTSPDAMIAYGVDNWSPRASENIYCDVTVTIRKARKHIYLTNIEGPTRMELLPR